MAKQDEVERLCKLLNLSDEAISIAEGWSILPPRLKAHFSLLLGEHLARELPVLQDLFANASRQDQLRFDRLIEKAQDRARGIPPE